MSDLPAQTQPPAQRKLRQAILTLLLTSVATGSWAQSVPAAPADAAMPPAAPGSATVNADGVQPKFFFWGLLINYVAKWAMQTFGGWVKAKSSDVSDTNSIAKVFANSANTVMVSLSKLSPFGAKSAGALVNTTTEAPTVPIKVDAGRENYQGVHVAVVEFGPAGELLGAKPLSAGFATGERIKLKVLPTFDGMLVVENINPAGERTQIYPEDPSKVVSLKGGTEVFIPLARDDYFEFAGDSGGEQLVITLRDPRAFGDAASTAPASRQDDATGSSFLQETPNGRFPVIAQSLSLNHKP